MRGTIRRWTPHPVRKLAIRPRFEALQANCPPRPIKTQLFDFLAIIFVDAQIGMERKPVLSGAAPFPRNCPVAVAVG